MTTWTSMRTPTDSVRSDRTTLVLPRPRVPEQDPPSSVASPAAGASVSKAKRRATGPSVLIDGVLAVGLGAATADLAPSVAVPAAVVAAAWPPLLALGGHYRHRALGESRSARAGRVLLTGARALVLVLLVAPWYTTDLPLAILALVGGLTLATVAHALLGVRRRRPRVVLAGRPRDVREALVELCATRTHEVVAACLTRDTKASLDVPTYVGLDASSGVAHEHRADAVVVLPGARMTPAAIRRLHWALAGVGAELCIGTGLLDVAPSRTRVVATGGLNLVHVVPASLRGPRRAVKDVVERCAAVLLLAAALPVLAITCLVIRADSPGSAIYRQVRVGRDGRHFTMFKLRTMSTDADRQRAALLGHNESDGVLFKIQRDPRVTRVGSWLRRWSIDEVPQLWNVVRGDMALVGPRPALPEEVAQYDVDPTRRLAVKPGLTGLWQVSGRSDLSWGESVRLDVKYVDNWSLRLDAHILLRTAKAILGHKGAY